MSTYSDLFIAPMRAELMGFGVNELRTPEDVEAAVKTDRRHSYDRRQFGARLRRR
jgi:hypothetical protein